MQLRLAGIGIMEASIDPPGRPYFFVGVLITKETEDGRAASISVEIRQEAMLARNGQSSPEGATWQVGTLIENPTTQAVDRFLNDWLSVSNHAPENKSTGGNLYTQEIVKELKAERNRLDRAIAALDGESTTRATVPTHEPSSNGASAPRKRHRLTAAGRKRLSDMMKKRWAQRKKKSAGKN
jgi:hypothetical protein